VDERPLPEHPAAGCRSQCPRSHHPAPLLEVVTLHWSIPNAGQGNMDHASSTHVFTLGELEAPASALPPDAALIQLRALAMTGSQAARAQQHQQLETRQRTAELSHRHP
jgi:hypothetical protein